MAPVYLLDNPIRPYSWGSRTAIANLRGVEPSGEPEAELWMGAHPASPSIAITPDGRRSLLDLITAAPETELGDVVAERFGVRLPFLLKVLAAEQPLSLQAHPNPAQARAGYEAENAAGIPLDAPHRNYKDPDAKPELITPLTPFSALAGFREPAQTLAAIDRLGNPELAEAFTPLREDPSPAGIERVFSTLLEASEPEKACLVTAALDAARAHPDDPNARLIRTLAEHHPGDIGVVVALLMNVVELAPGEAIYLPAGILHAYVRGVGVEILANSDNVLRGGLTGKHVDVPELRKILDFTPGSVDVIRPVGAPGGEAVYPTPAEEFRLARVELHPEVPIEFDPRGPQILLCIAGAVRVTAQTVTLDLNRGQSVFTGASAGVVRLVGRGTVFRATVGG